MHREELKNEEKNYYFFIIISVVIVLLLSFFLAGSPFFINRVVTVERDSDSVAMLQPSVTDDRAMIDSLDEALMDDTSFIFETESSSLLVTSSSSGRVVGDNSTYVEPPMVSPSSEGAVKSIATASPSIVAVNRSNSSSPSVTNSSSSKVQNSSPIKPSNDLVKPTTYKDSEVRPIEQKEREKIKSPTTKKIVTNSYQPTVAYWVQIASFSSIDRAKDIRQEMLSMGISIHIETIMLPQGKMIYRLRAGAWSNEDEAKRFMMMMRSVKNFEDAYITKSIMSKKV